MKLLTRRSIELLLAGGVAWSLPALAGYTFTSIDYPGAVDTQVFGVNNSGQVTGDGFDAVGASSPFVYDAKKGSYTLIASPPGLNAVVFGINEAGVMAGGVDDGLNESGFVRNKKGAYTTFSHPGCADAEARGVNNSGLVAGWGTGCGGPGSIGFVYDPASNAFIDFLPSPTTIVQGINGKGQVVGSVRLDAGVACTGCPPGSYGFLRAPSGAVTYFRVNGEETSARGITDSGQIAGTALDSGFVTTLAGLPYEAITIPNAALLAFPGAVQTTPEGITNGGDIVGIWTEFLGGDPNDLANYKLHGFIATKK
jgi:hypothetical protein